MVHLTNVAATADLSSPLNLVMLERVLLMTQYTSTDFRDWFGVFWHLSKRIASCIEMEILQSTEPKVSPEPQI